MFVVKMSEEAKLQNFYVIARRIMRMQSIASFILEWHLIFGNMHFREDMCMSRVLNACH